MSLSIPLEKRDRALNMLNNLLDRKKAKVKEIEKLCGFLNFLSRTIFPGRAFTRRMYSKFSFLLGDGNKSERKLWQHHHVNLDKEFKFDCRVWQEFLSSNYRSTVNRPMVDLNKHFTAQQLNFYSDASAA